MLALSGVLCWIFIVLIADREVFVSYQIRLKAQAFGEVYES